VVDGGAHERQAYGDVHAGFESEDLHRTVTLVVIHRHDEIEVAAAGAKEERIGGKRPFHANAARAEPIDRRDDLLRFLATPEEPALAGVRIDAAYRDSRPLDTHPLEERMAARDRALHTRVVDQFHGIEQSDVRRHVDDAQVLGHQHHRDLGGVREVGEELRVPG
jgi:hypothetical protein